MVEHWSPKPGAAGSSPATPAKKTISKYNMNVKNKKTNPAQFVEKFDKNFKVTWADKKDTFISSIIIIVLIILFSIFLFIIGSGLVFFN